MGVWGKWVKHAKYIYNIQDFNPEQVLAVGYTKSKLVTDAMMWLWATVSYMIAPWITLALIYIAANMLYKYVPRFYGLICGGRIKNE